MFDGPQKRLPCPTQLSQSPGTSPRVANRQGPTHRRNPPDTRLGLRSGVLPCTSPLPSNVKLTLGEVDVAPLEPEQFGLPQAGRERRAQQCGVVVSSLRLPSQLLGRSHEPLHLRVRPLVQCLRLLVGSVRPVVLGQLVAGITPISFLRTAYAITPCSGIRYVLDR